MGERIRTGWATRRWWAFKHRLREAVRWSTWHSGAARLGGGAARRRRIVFVYHTVGDEPIPANPNNLIPSARFRRQMELVRASGRPVVPLADLAGGAAPPGAVALTFDDGYRGCLEVIAPILEELAFTATFFVCPGFVDRRDAKWDDLLLMGMEDFEKRILRRPRKEVDAAVAEVLARRGEALRRRCADSLLGWDELRELVRRGFAVESHTLNHYYLSAQTQELQGRELRESRARLEAELGRPVEHLAYPFGDPGSFDRTSKAQAKAAGYTAAFAFRDRYAEQAHDPYEIPRFGISRDLPSWKLELILSGLYL